MQKKLTAILAGAVFACASAFAGAARAQSWSEANTPGFVGGYGHFGGYYDTFGDFGGHSDYRGYVRTEGYRTQTVTLLTVPLQKRAQASNRSRAKRAALATQECGWLRRRARTTGQRKWTIRYDACRNMG